MGGATPPVKDKLVMKKSPAAPPVAGVQRAPTSSSACWRIRSSSNQPSASACRPGVSAAQAPLGRSASAGRRLPRGGRGHLAREDCHEQQRNQRIDQVSSTAIIPLEVLPCSLSTDAAQCFYWGNTNCSAACRWRGQLFLEHLAHGQVQVHVLGRNGLHEPLCCRACAARPNGSSAKWRRPRPS